MVGAPPETPAAARCRDHPRRAPHRTAELGCRPRGVAAPSPDRRAARAHCRASRAPPRPSSGPPAPSPDIQDQRPLLRMSSLQFSYRPVGNLVFQALSANISWFSGRTVTIFSHHFFESIDPWSTAFSSPFKPRGGRAPEVSRAVQNNTLNSSLSPTVAQAAELVQFNTGNHVAVKCSLENDL